MTSRITARDRYAYLADSPKKSPSRRLWDPTSDEPITTPIAQPNRYPSHRFTTTTTSTRPSVLSRMMSGMALGRRSRTKNVPTTSHAFGSTLSYATGGVGSKAEDDVDVTSWRRSEKSKDGLRSSEARLEEAIDQHTRRQKAKKALELEIPPRDESEEGLPLPSGRRMMRSPQADRSRRPRGLVGLRNLGNTCFMNSVIQCLSNIKPLTEYFLSDHYLDDINRKSKMKGKLAESFGAVIRDMWSTSHSFVSPIEFKGQVGRFAARFIGYEQQDAQEFLRFVLDGLHEDLNRKQKKKSPTIPDDVPDDERADLSWKYYLSSNSSMISDMFLGQLRSAVVCLNCHHVSSTFDPFLDLSVPIPRKYQSKYGGSCSLTDCFDEFTAKEKLDGGEKYKCDKCKHRVVATKHMDIHRPPIILVVHIKRFVWGTYARSKLTTSVSVPLRGLDLNAYCSGANNAIYDLLAISEHSGSLIGGHYTAHCLNADDEKWYSFNDSSVNPSNPRVDIGSSGAYVLFFTRRDAE